MIFYSLLWFISAEKYAILMAGSFGYYNYRHQADIYTLYNQLIRRGYKSQNIITLSYDDVVDSDSNIRKGEIFHDENEPSVYIGKKLINYTENSVTAYNFYQSFLLLNSTENDDIFIYYDDHGGPGTLATPQGSPIKTIDLDAALMKMYNNRKYKRILFGIEACHAGSVVRNLKTPNIIYLTAANADESSYASGYSEYFNTYLTNEFTNNWLIEMDEKPDSTIEEFYENVRNATEQSHASIYGDFSLKTAKISDFLGFPSSILNMSWRKTIRRQNTHPKVPQSEATRFAMERRMNRTTKQSEKTKLKLEIMRMEALHTKFDLFLRELVYITDADNYDTIMNEKTNNLIADCYFSVLDHFLPFVGKYDQEDLVKLSAINGLCQRHSKRDILNSLYKIKQ
ncbi:Clan CD, family C13, asparaginyl endopeptidase-like cysteine peptidase [Tritrichomonas foetus]|uniref:Clan CD, family C13, asparaginyl endopeptidase-like cysteine peptidase n=1 Tax=Tritrichomonas foetus TaxID=1144522 RepID=A0A1J4JC45_9EUKA|nr:Clan CD, family C13, asparaginyl endopeptidase-like cysteine peptidase [Tritrichomonas foetus]|eukprot:OHS95823.1 Clan CD, family C13, asparaginyl endopeptidase-like cysteine peptidase [Tritrichomonas foetus]